MDTFIQNLIGALWWVTLHDENLSVYYWTDRSKDRTSD
jgi:hypothetical protein